MPENNDTPSSSGVVTTTAEMADLERSDQPQEGKALCLSGGGYRAMLFPVGAITRLNEMPLLKQLKRVSNVSDGALTAAVLGLNWHRLSFDQDGRATNLQDRITSHYQDVLFGDATATRFAPEPTPLEMAAC